MSHHQAPAVWFPTVRTGSGTDVFTKRLVEGLNKEGIRAEITWLPHRAEYAPWSVSVPQPPEWATVAHINTWLHSRFLPKKLPVVATLHHSIHDPSLRPYKGWLRAAYHRWWITPNERRVLSCANHITAVSQFVADIAKKTLCDVPIQVIYNGVDTEVFHPRKRVRQAGEPFRLLYIGAWKKLKGVDLLAPIMRELGNGFELHYTGGPAAEKSKTDMPGNMYDLGRINQKEVIEAMQKSDIFLLPTRSEGLPFVAIEAMACGLPVLATDCSSLPEIVLHNSNGWLCEKDNKNLFIELINKAATTNLYRSQKNARATAVNNFCEEKIKERYISLYRSKG